MRTFIAIPLTEDTRRMLAAMQDGLRRSRADVRWVSPPSIHLTLKFLGEVSPGKVAELAAALKVHSVPLRRFRLTAGGIGVFPALNAIRIVWCGIGGDLEQLSALQATVENTCCEMGFPREERPFSPHLTLGRVRGKSNLHTLRECIRIGSDLKASFEVEGVNVYKSTLTPQGSRYEVMEHLALFP